MQAMGGVVKKASVTKQKSNPLGLLFYLDEFVHPHIFSFIATI